MTGWDQKFDWNRARAFLATAQEGTFSAAARKLQMTQPTLGRQVAALENELGVALFERVDNALELTPGGLELLKHVRQMGDAAQAVALSSVAQSQVVEGSICIAATDAYATYALPRAVAKLRQIEPKIRVEIVSSNETTDLRARDADIALRNYRPTDPELVARKLRDAKGRLYASPEYLERLGNPTSIRDLKAADFVEIGRGGDWMNVLNGLGMGLTEQNFPLLAENHVVMLELARQGAGIGVSDERFADSDPMLRRVLPDMASLPFPLWLVVHREVKTNRRVRMVFEFLAAELS